MLKIFFENRLVYQYHKNPEDSHSDNDLLDAESDAIRQGKINDSKSAEDINKRLRELRTNLQSTSIFSDDDKKSWKGKLNVLETRPDEHSLRQLEEEFSQEKRAIQGMVDKYTTKVLDNKKDAFTEDKSREIDTAQEYLDWFNKLSRTEKEKALNKIDQDINERIKLRSQIIEKNPDLKGEVVKMRRSEMRDKLKELERIENNVDKARKLLERDKKYSSGYEHQLKHFADMTAEKQERYLLGYEEYYLKPRKEVADKYESLPEGIKNYAELPENLKIDFNKLKLKEKQQYLEKLEDFIEAKYEKKINELPGIVWSDATKRFAKNWFLQSPDLKTKAERLINIKEYIEREEKFRDEYLKINENIRKMSDYSLRTWEQSDGIQKAELLKRMKDEESMHKLYEGQLLTQLQNKTISATSYVRLMKDYTEGTYELRKELNRDFYNDMAPRKQLLEDFKALSEETKKHFQAEFLIHGYLNRKKIYLEAENYEKQKSKKELNADDINTLVEKSSKNTENSNLQEDLTPPTLNSQEEEELGKLESLEDIIEDQEEIVTKEGGRERLADQDKQFGENKFTKEMNQRIVTKSGGKKMLGKDGKIDDVEQIDISRFGQDKDQHMRVVKHMRDMAQNENYREVQLKDENGNVLTTQRAQSKFAQRKNTLIRRLGFRQKLNPQKAEKFVEEKLKR